MPESGSGDEIDRLARTMNGMLDRLEEGSSRQRRFVADTSHELRTPLTRMRTGLETQVADDVEAADVLRSSLLEEVRSLEATVEDLLTLARLDASAAPVERAPLDLDDLVGREVMRLRATSEVEVEMTGVTGAATVGDQGQLGRVIRNLLDNAERHARSTVRVACREEPDGTVVEVADDGPGIPESERARVFERFTRLDEARSAGSGGTGLGLAICRAIVEAHGGTIAVSDSDDGGACFTVRLPTA